MECMIRRSALVVCILVFAAQASAEVVLLSQSRSVFAVAWVSPVGMWSSDSLSAPDFGLFEEDASAFGWGPWGSEAEGFATQVSEIQTSHFSINGTASANARDGGWSEAGYGESTGRSIFEVLFEVAEPTPFSLAGTLARSGASLQLDRDGAPYMSFGPDGNYEIMVSEGGILEPGAYALTVKAMAFTARYSGYSSFDIDFFMETPVAVDQMAWGQVKTLFR